MKSISQYNSVLFILVLLGQFYISSQICIDVDEYRKTTYVRYGRKTCPDTADIVYEGIVGGTKHNVAGGGVNYLCLPLSPIYGPAKVGFQAARASVYSGEYQMEGQAPVDDHEYHFLEGYKVPCALCLVKSRSTTVTIPARNECPSSEWTKEYSGYLMANRDTHSSAYEYVCVDADMESSDGIHYNENGALFVFAEGRCSTSSGDGLPCGPYVDGYELTCAVCTI